MQERLTEKLRRLFCIAPLILLSGVLLEVIFYLNLNRFSLPLGLSLRRKILFSLPFCILFFTGYGAFLKTFLKFNVGTGVVRSGPYALVRHPLYATDVFSLPLLVVIWLDNAVFILPWLILIAIVHFAVKYEEGYMLEKFKDDYREYMNTVPAIVPYKAIVKLLRISNPQSLLMPLGMLGTAVYFLHVFLGQYLRKEYNWITTDISSLSAIGAPNRELLSILALTAGILQILFISGMVTRSFRQYHTGTRTGYILFLALLVLSTFGYGLFPLEGDKTVMTFSNLMHIVVTIAVVFLVISSLFTLSYGYLKQEKSIATGRITLFFAITVTLTGILNPVGMANGWNILGITERLNIFTLEIFIFWLSFVYTSKRVSRTAEKVYL